MEPSEPASVGGRRRAGPEAGRRGFVPGGALLHPVALAALALWGLNDHVLKAAWPGWWTGKLSDVASLVAFPLLALAAAQWAWWLARGRRDGGVSARGSAAWGEAARWSKVALVAAVVATSAVMASINTLPAAASTYEVGLGWLQWPFRGLLAMASGSPWPAPAPAQLWMDPTDLWTLPAALVALWVGWPRGARTDVPATH